MFNPFKNYNPNNQKIYQELDDELDLIFNTPDFKNSASNQQTISLQPKDEIDEFFSDISFNIELTPFEILKRLAADNKLTEFKVLQAQLIANKDPNYDIQEVLEWATNYHAYNIIIEIVEVQGVIPGIEPCSVAIENGNNDLIKYFFELGADPTLEILSCASHIDDTTILKYLLLDKGIIPPHQQWIDTVDHSFPESKEILNKAFLKHNITHQLPTKKNTKKQTMKI